MAAAEQISAGDSHDSDENDIASSTLIIDPLLNPENNSESFMDEGQRLLTSAVRIFVISEAAMQLIKCHKGVSELMNKIPLGLTYLGTLLAVSVLQSWLLRTARSKFVGFETYIRAASVVLEAYSLLLLINIWYARTAIIPAIILGFIAALCSKFGKNNVRFMHDHSVHGNMSSTKQMNVQLASTCLQLFFVILARYMEQQDGIFIISHFLLFSSTALSALPAMITSLPVGASPGVAHVLRILHKTCTVLLLITIHTIFAEWLEEDIVFACTPELVAVLVWFTIRYDHGGHTVSFDSLTSRRSELIVLSSVIGIVAYFLASTNSKATEILASWYSRAFRISGSSSALSSISLWMLRQWPENLSDSKGPTQLLMFSAKVCFCTTATVAVIPFSHRVLKESKVASSVTINTLLLLMALVIFGRILGVLFSWYNNWLITKLVSIFADLEERRNERDESFALVESTSWSREPRHWYQ